MISGTPLIFPSLGPTAFLLFRNPMQPAASPRNTLCGHAIGILCGYASLWLMGLTHDLPTIVEGVLAERVFCAALSLAATGALMVLLDVWHPPAGATTLIIAYPVWAAAARLEPAEPVAAERHQEDQNVATGNIGDRIDRQHR